MGDPVHAAATQWPPSSTGWDTSRNEALTSFKMQLHAPPTLSVEPDSHRGGGNVSYPQTPLLWTRPSGAAWPERGLSPARECDDSTRLLKGCSWGPPVSTQEAANARCCRCIST